MRRVRERLTKMALASGMCVYFLGSCAAAEEFRSVTAASFQSGLTTIATATIDGLFAVFEPDNVAE